MVKRTQNISVLIPDGESSFLQLVVNSLCLTKNVKVFVLSSKKADYMKYSRFVEKYIYCREASDLEWINKIDYVVEKHNIDIIMPIFQIGFKKIIKNQNFLKNKDKLCSLPSLNNFNTAIDKGLLYLHLEDNKLPCPKSKIVKPNNLPSTDEIEFPVIVKPVENLGGGLGIELIQDAVGLLNYYTVYKPSGDTIIQEYINGYDMGCNVLCNNGELLAYTIQKGNLYSKTKFSSQVGLDIVKEDAILETAKMLMKSLNWSGIANIDWRFDEKDGKFKVLEINPRYWMTTEASAFAGINFPYLYCLSSLNIDIGTPEANLISFLNLKGVFIKVKNNPLFVFKIKYILNNTSFGFVLKDPVASFYKFIWDKIIRIKEKINFERLTKVNKN